MNTFGRSIAILLAIILICIYPLKYISVGQEDILNNHVHQETKYFAEEMMLKGYLTDEMYANYLNRISNTNQFYNINLVHTKQIAGMDTAASLGDSHIASTLLNDLNEDSITTKNLATHTHTSDCYDGHRHDETCVRVGDTTKQVYVEYTKYTDSSESSYAPQIKTSIYLYCATCKRVIMDYYTRSAVTGWNSHGLLTASLQYAAYDSSGNIVQKVHSMSSAYTLMDSVFQATNTKLQLANNAFLSNVTSLSVDRQYVNPGYTYYVTYPFNWTFGGYLAMTPYSHTTGSDPFYVPYLGCVYCGKDQPAKLSCGQIEDTTVECNQVVTKIEATNPIQTVEKGSSIITTAIATMLDGTTKIVNCSSNFNTNILGKQTVTLTYTGLVDTAKKQGTKTTTIEVTVELNRLPTKLTVSPSSNTVYNGNEPSYTVRVYYDDNTSAIVTTGYTKTGFTSGAGVKNVTFTYVENGVTVKVTIQITVLRNKVICDYGHTYELDDYDTDLGCPTCKVTLDYIKASPETLRVNKGDNLSITVTAYYLDGHSMVLTSGWTSNYDKEQIGYQTVIISYGGKSTTIDVQVLYRLQCSQCGLIYEGNMDGTDPGCPVCTNQVISISATPNRQVVEVGHNINLTVTATYRNGTTSEVGDWHSDFDPFKVGVQEVTIYYKTVVTKVIVEVQSEDHITCPICGTSYNPIAYPNGCPVCYKTIDYIEAYLRSDVPYVQLGSELSIYIVIVYKDGHRSVDYGDWTVEGYRPSEVGHQRVTVHYKGHSTFLDIEVVNTLQRTVCSNGHVYYLNEDGSDPGCYICSIQEEKEAAVVYHDVIYTDQILIELDQNGIYYFEQGDYISVSVTVNGESIYESLQNMFFVKSYIPKEYHYGGMINSEKF